MAEGMRVYNPGERGGRMSPRSVNDLSRATRGLKASSRPRVESRLTAGALSCEGVLLPCGKA